MAALVQRGERSAEEVQNNTEYMRFDALIGAVHLPSKPTSLPVTDTVAVLMRRCVTDGAMLEPSGLFYCGFWAADPASFYLPPPATSPMPCFRVSTAASRRWQRSATCLSSLSTYTACTCSPHPTAALQMCVASVPCSTVGIA